MTPQWGVLASCALRTLIKTSPRGHKDRPCADEAQGWRRRGVAGETTNPRGYRGFCSGGRYWDRTSDLFRVREARYRCANRPDPAKHITIMLFRLEVDTGFEPVYTALQAAASPLGQSTVLVIAVLLLAVLLVLLPKRNGLSADSIRADDEIRTRDPHLGKVMRYHCATSATARISACFEDSSR